MDIELFKPIDLILVCVPTTEHTVPGALKNSLNVERTEERERGGLEKKEREREGGKKNEWVMNVEYSVCRTLGFSA